jgi:hypothetical protein
VRQVHRRPPERELVLVADSAYAALDLLLPPPCYSMAMP